MQTQRIPIILTVASVINIWYANAQTLTPIETPRLPTQLIAPIDLTQSIMAVGDRLSQQYAEKEEITDANIYMFLKESAYDVMPYNSSSRMPGFNWIMDSSKQITAIYISRENDRIILYETFNKENSTTGKIEHIDFRITGDSKVSSISHKTMQVYKDVIVDYNNSDGQVRFIIIMPLTSMSDFKIKFREHLSSIKKAKDYFRTLVFEDYNNTYH